MPELNREPIDRPAVRRAFDRAAARYDDAASLQREAGEELLERLDGIRINPARIIDLGCGTGHGLHALMQRYRRAEVIGLDFAPAMLHRARDRGWLRRRPPVICADMTRLPLADASVDLLYSNMAFQWVDDANALFRELRRVLRPEGVLLFSSFGPDTLIELRQAWATVDDHVHVSEFADMHDIGDVMLAAGLRDPVMDVDRVVRKYADLQALMREIKAIGAGNAAAARSRGLVGRRRMQLLEESYPAGDEAGVVPATWELVFGHAWGASETQGGHGDAREFHVPISSIKRRNSDQVS